MPINIILGAIAGITIFLGLPIARWRGASEKLRGTLALASAGVLLFLVIEVGYQAMESVEVSVQADTFGAALSKILILVVGFAAGLIGLAWIEERRGQRREAGADALSIATMIAIGIGLHNFAEGLAIGQSFAGGAVGLGTVLVVGFALHNATEGFGIAAPLAGREVGWGRLFLLGLIAGGPTALGSVIGGIWVNPFVELLFLSLAVGSLVYVTRELLRIRFNSLGTVAAMTALSAGLLLGFGTELVTKFVQPVPSVAANNNGGLTIRFANRQADPSSINVERGQTVTIVNDDTIAPLVFEGNGMFVGEIVVPPGKSVTVKVTGGEGRYTLVDERGQSSTVAVNVKSGGSVETIEPLTDEVNAVGALTVLEGHVRTSKLLHERGAGNQGPNPALDIKRAGKHAGHPQHELLEGSEPDALALQKLLREKGVFDSLNDNLSAFVAISGDPNVSKDELESKYQAVLDVTENARRAIAGNAYDTASFRARTAQFVLNTAASEYATACGEGQITVDEPGVPGRDNYIEYQDARGFIQATREFLKPFAGQMSADSNAAFDKLLADVFVSLDPVDPNHPVPPDEVKTLAERAGNGIAGTTSATSSPSQSMLRMSHH
jgi:ZIP family zinc transporter